MGRVKHGICFVPQALPSTMLLTSKSESETFRNYGLWMDTNSISNATLFTSSRLGVRDNDLRHISLGPEIWKQRNPMVSRPFLTLPHHFSGFGNHFPISFCHISYWFFIILPCLVHIFGEPP